MQRQLPEPGDVVAGKYVISRLIGRGGMGAVYVVEHRVTGKRLALKCLLPEYLEHPEFTERFLREAQAAGRIEHRSIVDVFDVGQDGDLLYIVMELLHGKTLSELLREGRLSLEETLQILLRAMDGVAAAHELGIVHRDLKPDNIMVCVGQSGRLDDPRVLDFGISKLEDDVSKPLTKSGVMLGTPYYMAFEQINSQRDLDQRVDVYAMGVILYEAMAGRPPYVAESVGALAIRMMSGPPEPISQLRPELPAGLADVVMRSVARDRNERYPTMRALIEALRPYVPESAGLLLAPGAGTPLGTSLRRSQGIDPTLPAASTPSAPLESSAKLRLHGADSHMDRAPRAEASSTTKTLLWVASAGLVLLLTGVSLLLALRRDDEEPTTAPPPVTSAPPRVPSPPRDEPVSPPVAPAPPPSTTPAPEPAAASPEPAPTRAEPSLAPAEPTPEPSTSRRSSRRKGRRAAEEARVPEATPAAPAPAPAPATEPTAVPPAPTTTPAAPPPEVPEPSPVVQPPASTTPAPSEPSPPAPPSPPATPSMPATESPAPSEPAPTAPAETSPPPAAAETP